MRKGSQFAFAIHDFHHLLLILLSSWLSYVQSQQQKNKALAQVFSSEFCEIFKNTSGGCSLFAAGQALLLLNLRLR